MESIARIVQCKSIRIARNADHYRSRPRPSKRIKYHERLAFFALHPGRRVNSLGHLVQRPSRNLPRRHPHPVIILLRILINDADPRPRRQIVELVEQHLLPILVQLVRRILRAKQPRQRRKLLRVQHLFLAVAHVFLVHGLRGVDAAMILEIHLRIPRRNRNLPRHGRRRLVSLRNRLIVPHLAFRSNLLLDRREKALRSAELILCRHRLAAIRGNCGSGRRGPAKSLVQHRPRRPSAVIAHTVKVHHFRHARRLRARRRKILAQSHRTQVQIHVVVRKISQHLRSIRRLPPEQLERQLVGVVPRHFLRDEVVDAALLVDLRQLPRVSKRIGIPADPHVHAVRLLVPALAHQNLPHQRLAVRHIQVRLNPHAAHNLPAAFFDALRDLVVQRRILLRHPLVVGRSRLRVSVAEILVHQLQRRAKGAVHHVHGFGPRPQPRRVNVRVAVEQKRGLLQQRPQRLKLALRRLQAGIELGLIVRIQRRQIHSRDGVIQNAVLCAVARRKRRQQQRRRKKLVRQALRIRPALREIRAQGSAAELFHVDRLEQLNRDHHLVAGPRIIEQHLRLQVLAQSHAAPVEVKNLRNGSVGVGRELEPNARAGQIVAVERRRQLNRLPKPHRVGGVMRARGRILPSALVEGHSFAVRQIALVHLPRAGGQLRQAQQPFHHGARLGRQQRKAPAHFAATLRGSSRGNE